MTCLRLPLGADGPSRLSGDCLAVWKQCIFMPNQSSPLGEHVWSSFHARKTSSKAPVHSEQEAVQALFCIGLVEKKARVVFWDKIALVLLFLP